MSRAIVLFLCLIALDACSSWDGEEEQSKSVDASRSPAEDENVWAARLLEERESKDREFQTSATSPMAGSLYLMSEPRDTVYLIRKETSFELAYFPPVPGAVLMINKEIETWHWYDQGVNIECRRDGQPLPNGAPLQGAETFELEGMTISCHPRKDRVAFIVFDPERPEMKSFEHLLYFPPDEKYAVRARLTPFSDIEEVTMLTSQNLEKVFYRYAAVEFEVEGKQQQLTAFKYALDGQDSKVLFIPFKDTTSGRETYGGGRFLEIEEPEEADFVLDFNRCFNPLCNYSPAYNCPYPPEENHLEIAIRAGEKTYPH